MLPKEAFLSHSSKDHEFTERLACAVRAHGIPIWYSEANIVGAQQWHDEIGMALNRCDWFLLALSPASTESIWVKRELLFALQQKRLESRIVPILLQPCAWETLSWTLPSSQFVDFTGSFEAGCRNLLRVWGIGYDPAKTGS